MDCVSEFGTLLFSVILASFLVENENILEVKTWTFWSKFTPILRTIGQWTFLRNIVCFLVARKSHLSGCFGFVPQHFGMWRGPMNGTLSFYECGFSGGDTQNSTICKRISSKFLHSQAAGMQKLQVWHIHAILLLE